MSRSSSPEPVTAVTDLASAWLPARMAEVERRLGETVRGWGARARGRGGGDPGRRRQADAPDAGPALRRAAQRATRRSAPPPRSSSSTWRRSSTTTSSTPRPLRRGLPTVVANAGPSPRPSPPATCSSPAPSRSSPPTARTRSAGSEASTALGTDRQVELLAHASVALARGELAQRRDAFDTRGLGRALPAPLRLKTAALFECACVIGASRTPSEEAALLTFGRAIGLAFQLLDDVLDVARPARADRQGARHRPARRHGDPAVHPRPRPRPGAARARPPLARARPRRS